MRNQRSTDHRPPWVTASTGGGNRWFFSLLALLWVLGSPPSMAGASAPVYDYEYIASYPHDVEAFTQGLIVEDGYFYEGTGLYGGSSLRKVELESGTVLKQHDLSSEYFGEGITALRDTLYQLTWMNHEAFAYVEEDTFSRVATYAYSWSGWGLTHNGTHLIASDGSTTLRFLDPSTLTEVSQITVRDGAMLVDDLNELEYIGGRIYANVWYSDWIAVIDPASGNVDAWLDLGGLRDSIAYHPDADVLNGIAFEAATQRLFVTGKLWPEVFEIHVPTLDMGLPDPNAPAGDQAVNLRCLPNPCRGQAVLTYEAPAGALVRLSLFDALGRRVRRYAPHRQAAGTQAIVLDTSRLPAGTYFLRFSAAESVHTAPLRILR